MYSARVSPSITAAVFLTLLLGCAQRVSFMPGDECELNTQCTAPLVCRLGRCRVECRAPRDCDIGLACVRDARGLGACQLPSETECELTSDCPDFLVCRFGRCTNACDTDRDCAPGARCVEESDQGWGCRDSAHMECQLNTDCEAPYVCAVDRRCREECRADRDCRDGQSCLPGEPPVCGRPSDPMDGGPDPVDGGPADAFTPMDGFVPPDAPPTTDGGLPLVGPPARPLLAAGLSHSCAAPTPGDLRCWGANDQGQLGDGTTVPRSGPYALSAQGLTSVRSVAAGARHTCVVEGGAVLCWGDDAVGQVGNGAGGATPQASPVPVSPALPGAATEVVCGSTHTCAIADSRLFCWGGNASGQLGVGDTADRPGPTEVTGLGDTPVAVSAFGDHTCVRLAGGTVSCFGENASGQLGRGGGVDSPVPVAVPGLDRVAQISAGTTHTCALRDTGAVLCWGRNTVGQLGRPTTESGPTPAPVVGLGEPVLQLGLGSQHSCARASARIYCWGNDLFGQLGYAAGGGFSATPTEVPGLTRATSVHAGTEHTCVWVGGVEVRCFGRNSAGQLNGTSGAGGTTQETVPWP